MALKALRSKALRLGRQKKTFFAGAGDFPIDRKSRPGHTEHVTSRFGVALCILNLPNIFRRDIGL